ncbi:MAG TPA: NAD(P)H-hydrate dehydratase, partial [candidate division WOR-3 bacterium]|nr:NAD(P)H-hydrate dehydratase [candidate division WOR-3 bacterium]
AGHKGTFGTVLIIAGSRGFSGAACLTGLGAVRAGAGLVKMACPVGVMPVIEARLLEAVKLPCPETEDGGLGPEALPDLLAADAACAAIGPGLGTAPATRKLLRALLSQLECPMVIDADALNCLAGSLDILDDLKAPAVLTPHPGEMARIEPAPAADRVELARRFVSRRPVVLLLKGAPTIIAAPGRPAFINSTGNSGLATGGTGDVLTGIIAGLLAQGAPPFDAARAGAWLHGRAADLAVAELTEYSLAASDLLQYLPAAFAAALGSRR